jgi:hypothetical protein
MGSGSDSGHLRSVEPKIKGKWDVRKVSDHPEPLHVFMHVPLFSIHFSWTETRWEPPLSDSQKKLNIVISFCIGIWE